MKKFNLLFCTLFFLGAATYAKHIPNVTGKGKSDGRVNENSATCTLTATASATNVTCNGGSDGSVSATPASGTAPYTYMWGDGNTNSGETGLIAGTYSVTVTDNDGCTATAAATIAQPSVLSASAGVVNNVTCNGGSDGSVSTTPSNGTAPYTYSWTSGGTNSTETGLAVGTYTITVTDNCGATATASATITQPSSLSASAGIINNVTCNGGNDGSISSTPSNGTAPYTYSWTGGGTNSTATGLTVGTYTITVTDNCGATATASASITQPTTLSVSANTTANVSCDGGSDGSVYSTPLNGTSPYTYSWTGGGTNSTVTGLTAGTYSLTVTDNCGATATASVTITQPSTLIVLAGVSSNVTCNGGSNGSVSSTPSNGSAPYTYSWTGGGTSLVESGLSAGTYTITVTDICGATATASATITQPTAISVSVAATYSVICLGNADALTTTVSGGNAPYTYSWSPAGGPGPVGALSCYTCQNPIATPLTSTTFTVTVTDITGCTGTSTVTITVDIPSVSVTSSSNLICPGANTTLTASVEGGTSPFTYAWTPSSWLSCPPVGACSSPTAYPPVTISYNVVVTDANGCSHGSSVTVNVDNMSVSTHLTPPAACIGSQVVLSTTIIGGQHPFTYLWSPGSITKSKDTIYTPVSSTTYSITVSDSIGCSASTTAVVSPDNFSASLPNRTTICAISATGEGTGGLTPSITGGVAPFTYSWSNGHTSSYLAYAGLTSGIYSVTVTDGDGCTATTRDTLTVNPVPTITITSSKNPIQIGWVDTLNVTGGIGYIWSDGSTTTRIVVRPRISTEYSVIGWNSYSCSSNVSITEIVTRDYFMPSPDTLIPHLTGFPPIYYDGNVSIGGDSAYSPTQALQVHGNTTIDSNLTVKGTMTAGKFQTSYIKADSITAAQIRTDSIFTSQIIPHDSILYLGGTKYAFLGTHYVMSNPAPPSAQFFPHTFYCSPNGGFNFLNNPFANCPVYLSVGGAASDAELNVTGPCLPMTYLFSATNTSLAKDVFTIDQNGKTTWGAANNTLYDGFGQGGAIELGGNDFTANPVSGGKPYIDFHYGVNTTAQDFNVRMINSGDGQMDFVTAYSGWYPIMSIIGGNNSNGNYVRVTEIKVCLTGCDFVFDKNYKLKSLKDLEEYLNINHHLPGIESASEMQSGDGVALGKLNSALLQKVEELTLYIIQQQKQIDQMNDKLNALVSKQK